MKYEKIILFILSFFILSACFSDTMAASPKRNGKKQKTAQAEKKEDSAYDKVFKDKKHIKTERGLMTVHIVDGKIYMELPLSLIGRDLAINSFIEESSNTEIAYIGRKVSASTNVVFSKTDSLVVLSKPDYTYFTDNPDNNVQNALDNSSIGAVLYTAPVISPSPDSTALLFEVTNLVLSDNKIIASLSTSGGIVSVAMTFKKDKSFPSDIFARDNNVSFLSTMSYEYKFNIMGFESANSKTISAKVRTVFSILPETPVRHRMADPRVGTALTPAMIFDNSMEPSQTKYFARRWRLEPGKQQDQIVFHIDTLFPAVWQKAIIEGVEKWNGAFEKIGFGKVLTARLYPAGDPRFSANDISYNCIKYVQNSSRDINASTITDPRSGEILGASIYFPRDAAIMMQRDVLIQTGAADRNARYPQLPDELISKAITANIMHAVGVCLGLATNNAGTAAYQVDMLRDPDFTRQNGFTSTVMCPVKYNYVAQPGDVENGVVTITEKLGPYDYFAISWLYTPLDAALTYEQEFAILDKWIKEKGGNPQYRFLAAQNYQFALDPRASGVLGDDLVSSARLALKNNKYIVDNGFSWVDTPGTDEIYLSLFADFVFLDAIRHFNSISNLLGSMYINDHFAGDAEPSFVFVPRQKQKEALDFILNESSDMAWMNNRPMMWAGGMGGNMPGFAEFYANSYLFARLQTLAFGLGSSKEGNPYPYNEVIGDISEHVLRFVRSGRNLPSGEKSRLEMLIAHLMRTTPVKPQKEKSANSAGFALAEDSAELLSCMEISVLSTLGTEPSVSGDVMGFTPMTSLKYYAKEELEGTHFRLLKKILNDLDTGAARSSGREQKDYYGYLSLKIRKFIAGQ